ncbi:MAG TPA: M20 family metallopeptidase [Phycisphaerae bacterium]|nr:M20 family metallopeptidase [Phycisphaerae bacterium]HPS53548.1 M20 family metallopeptidase [Phycisphaerae bacterium]
MTVKKYISDIHDELVGIRRELHANPQVGFHETFASGLVQDYLRKCGIEFQAGLAETGVVGWLLPEDISKRELPGVALRADIDALTVEEKTGLTYASHNEGCMHACGHDGHTVMLLGAANVLSKYRRQLTRPVKFIFQPAEESFGGALPMIRQGVLDERTGGIRVNRIFAVHNWPALPLGRIGLRSGPFWASVDGFRVIIKGKGGHGARPQTAINPLIPAAKAVLEIDSIKNSSLPASAGPVVLSVCSINGGTKSNVIPDDVIIQGTIRTFDDGLASEIKRRISEIAADIAAAAACKSAFEVIYGYPVVVNDSQATDEMSQAAKTVLGMENVLRDYPQVSVAEDFSFYLQKVQGCIAVLGCGPSEDLHNPHYDFNDALIPTGVELFVRLAMQE